MYVLGRYIDRQAVTERNRKGRLEKRKTARHISSTNLSIYEKLSSVTSKTVVFFPQVFPKKCFSNRPLPYPIIMIMKSYCMNLNILRLYSNPLCIPVVKRISSISAFIHCKNYPRERELSCNILLPPSQQSATGPKSFFPLILQRQCVQIRAVYLQEHKWDNANISRHNLMSRVQAGLG